MHDVWKQDGNKKTATFNGEKTQFHCCERILQIWINRPQISDNLSPLTGVANLSQVVGPNTEEQSPEKGRGIKKNNNKNKQTKRKDQLIYFTCKKCSYV